MRVSQEVLIVGHATPALIIYQSGCYSFPARDPLVNVPLMMSTHGSNGRQSLVSISKVLIETSAALLPCIYEKPNSARCINTEILTVEAVQCVGIVVGIYNIMIGK
ncbi:MAG: hypothetical protein CL912_20515 [Deltaproteobacteria bacterium]|nr:hypothetical protein [Deltaproteobacteria bacterium]